mmetsp:Transcript_6438/g.17261  ORF Transcript_6438/g.17261 Transcript_6438/m.17261 type:complete len:294 (-) Transcript_6438:867-1748(-)
MRVQSSASKAHGIADRRYRLILAHNVLPQCLLHLQKLFLLTGLQARDGNACRSRNDRQNGLLRYGFGNQRPRYAIIGCRLSHQLMILFQFFLERGNLAVCELRGASEVTTPLGYNECLSRSLQCALVVLGRSKHGTFAPPTLSKLYSPRLQRPNLGLALFQPFQRARVRLFAQRALLDSQTHKRPVNIVQRLWLGLLLHFQTTRGFVDHIDGTVRKVSFGDVSMCVDCGRDQRAIENADAVMQLVAIFQSSQNVDGCLYRGLRHKHGLKAPRERSVFFDVPAKLSQRGGTHAV